MEPWIVLIIVELCILAVGIWIVWSAVVGAPWLPTPKKRVRAMLEIADVKPEVAYKRLKGRKHTPNMVFEKLNFMKKVDKRFKSSWFRRIFNPVAYIGANETIKEGIEQLMDLWDNIN